MDLQSLHEEIMACTACAAAGYFIGSKPIFCAAQGAIFMTIGQAPGKHEANVSHLPFSGPAGRRLFRWLADAGFKEDDFRTRQAMIAMTLCYPGRHPSGRGDRVPSSMELGFCNRWLEQEISAVNPRVLIPIGGLAIRRFLGNGQAMTVLIGERYELDGRVVVPLPHPSGASQWFNQTENKARLARALALLGELRAELDDVT